MLIFRLFKEYLCLTFVRTWIRVAKTDIIKIKSKTKDNFPKTSYKNSTIEQFITRLPSTSVAIAFPYLDVKTVKEYYSY